MEFRWEYPIAVLAHGGGYASIVEQEEESDRHSLIVVTDTDESPDLMAKLGILGAPRLIHNAREFRWLVESLREPVTHVAFDIDPVGAEPNPQAAYSIEELLQDHLVIDFSPWNYPVYIVAVEEGFASIIGSREDESPFHAIAVFRSRERADAFMEVAGDGEICELADLKDAVKFFTAMAEQVDAVALDPSHQEGQCLTDHCFAIETLLEKYLIEEKGSSDVKP